MGESDGLSQGARKIDAKWERQTNNIAVPRATSSESTRTATDEIGMSVAFRTCDVACREAI